MGKLGPCTEKSGVTTQVLRAPYDVNILDRGGIGGSKLP